MRAEELLRRYLEQRRELGESELVLDGMTVDEVLRILGAARAGADTAAGAAPAERGRAERPAPAAPAVPPPSGAAAPADWREALRAAGADVPAPGRRVAAASGTEEGAGRRPRAGAPGADAPSEPAPSAPPATSVPSAKSTSRAGEPPAGLVVGSADQELFVGPAGSCATLDDVARMVAACTRCDLYRTATHPVPGEGNPQARLMCVGEAPGANEDATGRPFVGQAGQLLTKILAAINLSRDEVFIANVLKHRPPGNRNPRPEEVEACRPYLSRQIELVRPKVIVAFGTFAAQTLLETKLAIGKLRGAVHRYHGIPVVVTYHPAALLRNPAWKRPTWEDVQLARRLLDSAAA
ncbi:MAG TPA: uracil-DNA glycosylase [Gemmatimonadaceae bacterium]|nr:uracil-DNA glycosylase [Gemmatimonadaceae bacterium]